MHRLILVFVVLSLVSLFADVVYEGGRSVSGNFLEYLGAPAIAAGVIAFGEFLGYAIRLPVGLMISIKRSSRALWATVVLGYALVIAIPFLALAVDWRYALLLYLVERLGKGLRTPARDVVIADITDRAIGRGRAFGLHELLDQVGAVAGPLIISYAIAYRGGYREAFTILLPFAFIAIALVMLASTLYPRVESVGVGDPGSVSVIHSNNSMKRYMVFVALLSLGLVHWSIISYHLGKTRVAPEPLIPLLYTVAMLVDAIVALPLGEAYDRYGISVLALLPILSMFIAPMVFLSKGLPLLIVASAIYGVILCGYDSILRAAVADIAKSHERAIGYGLLGFVWGVSWGLGNILGGAVYDILGSATLCILFPAINFVAFLYIARGLRRLRL